MLAHFFETIKLSIDCAFLWAEIKLLVKKEARNVFNVCRNIFCA